MKNSFIPCVVILALALWGCVSAERMAEYSAWQKSDDGVASVSLAEFASKYQNGWRERAATKMTQRFSLSKVRMSPFCTIVCVALAERPFLRKSPVCLRRFHWEFEMP